MKKIIGGLFTLILLLGFSIQVSAESSNNANEDVDEKRNVHYDYINERFITDVYSVDEEGNKVKVPFGEYMSAVKKSKAFEEKRARLIEKAKKSQSENQSQGGQESSDVTIMEGGDILPDPYYEYEEEASGTFLGRAEQVSGEYKCPYDSPEPCSKSLQIGMTKSSSWSAGLSYEMKEAVTASASITTTESSNVSETVTLPIEPGNVGWFEAQPYWDYTGGDVVYYGSTGLEQSRQYQYSEFPDELSTGMLNWYTYGVYKY